ncbi:LamG-like jellyroll fold domain-containing protein [Hyunsoonleella aestuarii]|uniref:LamG-like jellyroll fold domain-containing protein n=1 Tax=Hyunsoonleella aestuarii TaxID=912802 RepID=UPI001B85D44E|nr:LamG-like jellyroll fold domain-containing protein [Hyunsoonleella aestuarii]
MTYSGDLTTNLTAGTYNYTVTDANGCTANASATIAAAPSDITFTATANDPQCFGELGTVTLASSGGTGTLTYSGDLTTNLTAGTYNYTVTDANGCTANASATIAAAPSDITFTATANDPQCFGELGTVTLASSGGTGTLTYSGDLTTNLTAGTYNYTVTDANGCTANASATIAAAPTQLTASESVTDISCFGGNNGAINITVSGGTTGYTFAWTGTGVNPTAQNQSGLTAGSYSVTIIDANNCTFDINGISVGVADNTPPTITCPGNIIVNNDSGQCTAVVNYSTPIANDNCGVDSVTRISGPASGSAFPVGTTTVTYEVEDTNGNTETCSFTVTVNDNEPPVAQCKDYTIILDSDGANTQGDKLSTNDINDGSYDNCGNVSVAFDNFDGRIYCTDVGVIQVGLIITDSAGNTSTCTANVTVVDDIDPVAICRATPLTVQLDNNGNYTLDPALLDNGSHDGLAASNCGVSLSVSQTTFDCTDIGSNTVTLTATDAGGNTDTCDVTVIVEDNVQPTAVCQAYTVFLDGSGNGSLVATNIDGGSTDACGISNLVASQTTFDCSDLGLNSVRLTVTDNNGNSSDCFADVTVVDNIPPVAPTLTDITWGCGYTPATPTTNDNCTGGTITGVPDATFPITTTTVVTWTFSDNAGNDSTSTQTITINQISCLATETNAVSCNGGSDGEATVNITGGVGPFTYLWSNGQTTSNATGLSAGSHSVTVTDANTCSTTCSVTITEPTQLTSSITTQTGVTCYDAPIGSVTVAGANGTGPYTYQIDGGAFQGSGTFNGLTGGSHTVTVRDNNGCTVDQAVTIAGPTEALIADVQLTDANCLEPGSKGVVVQGQGGNGGYEYQMTGDASVTWTTDGDFGGLADGTYYFQVRDSQNCLSEVVEIVLNESTRVKVEIPSSQNVLCHGESTGSASGVVSSGKAPYTYLWDDPSAQTTLAATGLAAGTYTLTVTDFYNCPVTATVIITEPNEITISESHVDLDCNNGGNGSITLTAGGGTPGYQYNINNGVYGASNVFNGLPAGTHTMGVLDANGCEKQIDVILTEPTQITASYTTNTVGCAGNSNGTATVTASGGTPGYSYAWSNGQTGITATGLTSGTPYQVTITDANGCTLVQNVTYTDPAALVVNMTTMVTSGVGQSDGTATATPTGGVAPYTYSWSNDASGSPIISTNQTATGLSQGTYWVTVTDSKGCVVEDTVIVADIINIILDEETACDPNLSVDLQRLYIRLLDENGNPLITGGYGDLTYNWNFGSNVKNDAEYTPPPTTTVNDNSSLELAYTVGGNKTIALTVTDDSGQTVSYSFDIFIDSCIEFDVDCDRCVSQDYQLLDWFIGDADGNKLPSCGTAGDIINEPVYIWFFLDHGDNTNYNLNVVAEYVTTHPLTGEVTVESIEECLYEGKKIGTGAAYLFIDSNYVCGSTIEISKFLISWTKLARTPCGQREPKCFCPGFDIAVGSPLTAIAIATPISCYAGGNNGTATVEAFGGTEPYSYLWTTSNGSGLNPTAKDQTDLSPGTYTVTVTDSNTTYDPDLEMEVSDPYTFTTSVTVSEPTELNVDSFDPQVPPCFGSSNGYAQANASGGTPPYTYAWSNGQTTQTAINLSAGTYTVTVTDANGCTDQDSVTLTDPPLLTATVTNTEPSCFGDSNGTATVTPAGGTSGYTYLWSNGQTTQAATGLPTGNYSVTVTDANNCTAVANVTIGQPTALDASTTKMDVSCNGAANGTGTINVTGGTAPYTYLWSDAQTTQTAIALAPGTYNVVATDANGCQISRNITITQPTALSLSTEFNEPQCYNGANGGTAKIYPSGGTAPYYYLWSDGQTTQTAINLAVGTYTVVVTDANGCTENASIDVTQPLETFANAGLDQDLSIENCGVVSTTLNATGEDSANNPLPGVWTIVSGTGGSLSSNTDPNAIFTGQAGMTYQLLWEIDCAQDLVNITLGDGCNTLDFDGDNDHVTFQNQYNVSGNFSFEIWVKPDPNQNGGGANNPIQTIFSKRDATNLTNGYDLRLQGTSLSFNYNNGGSITASNSLGTNRWYHVAVTFDGSDYILYVDGIQVGTGSGSAPITNTNEFMLGAMDQNPAGGNPNPVNYYSGWMQELRIWNTALTVEQIRQMMNQTITNNGTATRGTVIPIDVAGLNWSNLVGYYRMLQPIALSGTGYLLSTFGIGSDGQMRNIETTQEETAPLPYLTKANGNWNTTGVGTPWLYGDSVWDYPNSDGITGDAIDWNIAQVSHDVISNTQDVTMLGLLTDTNTELIITNSGTQDENNPGHGLWITHYLRLDGTIDLVGESQLVQKRYRVVDGDPDTPDPTNQFSESILDTSSSGYIERDQQGATNYFNYNYWASPVSTINTSNNNTPFSVNTVLRDGTSSASPLALQWTSSYDPNPGTSGKTLSDRWIYTYENFTSNTYLEWRYVGENTPFNVGLGYTMKGSGAPGTLQNYVFMGKPNNGDITTDIDLNNNALVGNPYPSAINAREFIKDNIPLLNPNNSASQANPDTTGSIDGTLYFWIHFDSNNTHILRDYEGGYATYTLGGGISPPTGEQYNTVDNFYVSGSGNSFLIPGDYIPVGQGFFTASATANKLSEDVKFENDQRVFERESPTNSIFLKSGNSKNPKENASTPQTKEADGLQRLRLIYSTPEGARRYLLLAFTPNNVASDNFDYGYDAKVLDNNPNDMLFMIDDEKFVIQGVGAFDKTKQYPIGLFSKTGGAVEVAVSELENMLPNTKVYMYDSLLGTYTKINGKNQKFGMTLDAGDYTNRFYITFQKENNSLSIEDNVSNNIIVNYLQNSKEIYIKTSNGDDIKQVYLNNILGQTVKSWNKTNTPSFSNEMRIPVSRQVAEGTYIIEVQTASGSMNKKIVISN